MKVETPGAGGVPSAAPSATERTRIVRQFEGLFLNELWRAMESTLDEGSSSKSLFGGGLGGGLGGGSSGGMGALGPYGAILDGAFVSWLADTPLGNLGGGIEEALTAALAGRNLPQDGDGSLAALAAALPPAEMGRSYRPYELQAGFSARTASPSAAGPATSGDHSFEAIARRVDAQSDSIAVAARETGLDPNLLRAVVHQESAGDPSARSRKGALGLMQLMPDTARSVGVLHPLSARDNILGGARYLRALLERFGGSLEKALAAYNAGPGSVERSGGMPPFAETRVYVPRVLGLADRYRRRDQMASGSSEPVLDPMQNEGE